MSDTQARDGSSRRSPAGAGCGSRPGVPLAFAEPSRSVVRFNPRDEVDSDCTLLIWGRPGTGKTVSGNVWLSHHDAAGTVIDKEGRR